MTTWTEELLDFAYVPDLNGQLAALAADEAENEDWEYHNSPSNRSNPILYNYIRFTYKRIAEERKIALSDDGQSCCFNTGLVTPSQEPIFASFEVNRVPDAQPWYFKG